MKGEVESGTGYVDLAGDKVVRPRTSEGAQAHSTAQERTARETGRPHRHCGAQCGRGHLHRDPNPTQVMAFAAAVLLPTASPSAAAPEGPAGRPVSHRCGGGGCWWRVDDTPDTRR